MDDHSPRWPAASRTRSPENAPERPDGPDPTHDHGLGAVRAPAAILARSGTLSDRSITEQSLPGSSYVKRLGNIYCELAELTSWLPAGTRLWFGACRIPRRRLAAAGDRRRSAGCQAAFADEISAAWRKPGLMSWR